MNNLETYKILIASNASKLINFAASELQTFINKSTGINLEIVSHADCGNYVSIDNTDLSENVEFPENEKFNSSGFAIKTVDGNYIVMGKSEHGSLYGVYYLLEKWVGFCAYAFDEVFFETKKRIDLEPINYAYCPKIEYRHVRWYPVADSVGADPVFANRLKIYAGGTRMDGENADWYRKDWGDGCFSHTTFKILPPEKDENDEYVHKDWYNESVSQLCFSNDEMYEHFIVNLKKHIKANPNAKFFSIGIEDNDRACHCEKCKALAERYGGDCGVYLRFFRKLALDIEAWRKVELPDSKFLLVSFAYLYTKDPPIKIDENGNFAVYDKDLILPDNVAVINAPIDSCGLHSLDAPCNRVVKERFIKWRLYCKNTFVWDYHLYHDRILIFFPGLWQYKSNIQTYEKYNTVYMYNEGQEHDFTTGFAALKLYLLAKLSYDSSLDQDFLIDDFINHYYKKAAPQIKTFLNSLKEHYAYLEKEYAKLGGRGYHVSFDIPGHPDVLTERHWPKEFLLKMEALLADAELAADDEIIKKRVKREQLFIKYLLIELHTYYCGKKTFDKRVNEFKQIVAELGDVYNFCTWFVHWKHPADHKFALKNWYGVLDCRYPVRADDPDKE